MRAVHKLLVLQAQLAERRLPVDGTPATLRRDAVAHDFSDPESEHHPLPDERLPVGLPYHVVSYCPYGLVIPDY